MMDPLEGDDIFLKPAQDKVANTLSASLHCTEHTS